VTTQQDPRAADLKAWCASLSEEIAHFRVELQRCQRALADAEEKQALVRRLLELDGEVPKPNTRGSTGLDAGDSLASEGTSTAAVSMILRAPALANSQPLEDAVASILEVSRKPMHVSDIRLRLMADGVRIPGRGDDANVIVRLRKAPDRFTRTARGTYALTHWGLPSLDDHAGKRTRIRAKR
jgi:hypothetical protein